MVLLVELALTTYALRVGVATAGLLLAWSMEIARRLDPRVNAALMRLFARVAHPHEAVQVNSATWYTTAIFVLAVAFPVYAGVAGLMVLGFGDPAAAAIGQRFGRRRIAAGRTLEGSVAFVAVGTGPAFAGARDLAHGARGRDMARRSGRDRRGGGRARRLQDRRQPDDSVGRRRDDDRGRCVCGGDVSAESDTGIGAWWRSWRARYESTIAEYGNAAIAVYLAIFAVTIAGFWVAIRSGIEIESATGVAGSVGAAWIATKATQPLRIGATIAITPLAVQLVRRFRAPAGD